MGIRGLLSFLKKGNNFRFQRIEDTAVVVDGQNVLFGVLRRTITQKESSDGGAYPEIANTVRQMVSKMLKCGLTPIFVFDGVSTLDEDTWATVRSRNQFKLDKMAAAFDPNDRESTTTPLAVPVAVKVLKDMGVEVLQADQSADRAIALIAADLHCPILSGDTDFLMYNVDCVALAADDGIIDNMINNDNNNYDVMMWRASNFTASQRMEVSDLSLFAASAKYLFDENEFRDLKGIIKILSSKCSRPEKTEMLFRKYGQAKGKSNEKFLQVINEYSVESTGAKIQYLRSSTCSGTTFECKAPLPLEYQERWRRKLLPPYLVSVLWSRRVNMVCVLEDVRKPTVFDASKPIREVSYGILLKFDRGSKPPIEYTRVGNQFRDLEVRPKVNLQGFGPLPGLGEIPRLDLEMRQNLLMAALNASKDKVDEPPDVRFWLMVSRYWKQCGLAQIEHVRAMILSMILHRVLVPEQEDMMNKLRLSTDYVQTVKRSLNLDEGHVNSMQERVAAIHVFSQWQAIFMDALQLNQLLLQPLGDPSADQYFDGSLLLSLLQALKTDPGIVESWLSNKSGTGLLIFYRQMETRLI